MSENVVEVEQVDETPKVIHTGLQSEAFKEAVAQEEEWTSEELGEHEGEDTTDSGVCPDKNNPNIIDISKVDQVEFRRLFIELGTPKVGIGFVYELRQHVKYTAMGETEPRILKEVKFSKDVRASDLTGFAVAEINEGLKTGRMAQLISIVCGIPKQAALNLGLADIADLGAYVVSFLVNGPKSI